MASAALAAAQVDVQIAIMHGDLHTTRISMLLPRAARYCPVTNSAGMGAGGLVYFGAPGAWRPEDWQCLGSCLTDLSLSDLTAPVSAGHMSALLSMQSLESLDVSKAKDIALDDMTSIEGVALPKLERLALSGMRLGSLELCCPRLTSLNIIRCRVRGVIGLRDCSRLVDLGMHDCKLRRSG